MLFLIHSEVSFKWLGPLSDPDYRWYRDPNQRDQCYCFTLFFFKCNVSGPPPVPKTGGPQNSHHSSSCWRKSQDHLFRRFFFSCGTRRLLTYDFVDIWVLKSHYLDYLENTQSCTGFNCIHIFVCIHSPQRKTYYDCDDLFLFHKYQSPVEATQSCWKKDLCRLDSQINIFTHGNLSRLCVFLSAAKSQIYLRSN